MRYAYTAVDKENRIHKNKMDADNLSDLENRLRSLNFALIHANEIPAAKILFHLKPRVKRRDLIHFCFCLEQISRAKIPLLEGLLDLRDTEESPTFRLALAALVDTLEAGKTLSEGLRAQQDIFNEVFCNLIYAGEMAGNLAEVLKSLGEALKWEDELAAQTTRILIYPAFVAAIVALVAFFLMTTLVPQLKQFILSVGQELPLNTRILFGLADFLSAHTLLLFASFLGLILGIKIALKRSENLRFFAHQTILKLPFLGQTLQKISLSRILATFALLYNAKIPMVAALNITRGVVNNLVISRAILEIEEKVQEGKSVANAFTETRLFPPILLRMLRIGETTGALGEALLNVNYFLKRDVEESVGKVQALIEPVLTVVLGLLLGFIMLAVLGPVYDVVSNIKI